MTDLIRLASDLVLPLDRYLSGILQDYGAWTSARLFVIVFCETGLVVTPFLPGDSLLFAVGTFAAIGALDLLLVMLLLAVAAIAGDAVNYAVGRHLGPRVFTRQESRWLNPRHLDRTRDFYARYGAATIVLARFVPIVRTFAPFVAGIGRMGYPRFAVYNVLGAVLWIGSLTLAGYFFGNIPLVRRNFSLVILVIVVLSVLPAMIEMVRQRRRPA